MTTTQVRDDGGTGTAIAEQLTDAIRKEHDAASSAASKALHHALEAGRLLDEAKQQVQHGSWESYVRDLCGIAPRTASLYLRLHRNRDRLPNRQRVADLSVRQAAKLLAAHKTKETAAVNDARVEPGRRPPDWYRAGHRHYGSHPSGWSFEVWPHPAGEQWAHYYVMAPASGHPGDWGTTLVGPKRGIRVDAVVWSMNRQQANGMPPLNADGWEIFGLPCDLDSAGDALASRFKPYNSFLFSSDEDYRRRGMGLK